MARGYCLQMWTQMWTKTDLWIIYGHKTDLKTTGLDVRNKCVIDPLRVCALGWISACSSYLHSWKGLHTEKLKKSSEMQAKLCQRLRHRFQQMPISSSTHQSRKSKGTKWAKMSIMCLVICASYFIVHETNKLVDAGK